MKLSEKAVNISRNLCFFDEFMIQCRFDMNLNADKKDVNNADGAFRFVI